VGAAAEGAKQGGREQGWREPPAAGGRLEKVRVDVGGLQVWREPPAAFRVGSVLKRSAEDRDDEGGLQVRRKPPAAGNSGEVERRESSEVDRDHIGSGIPRVRWKP
jgi:hypothetical protein